MVPSATPSATSKFNTTYAGVQDKFAASISDADKAQAVLSQTVRQDYGLRTLVARLREQGTWQPDLIGLASAANQAFAGWVYQSLLPAIYDRYEISGCGAARGRALLRSQRQRDIPGVSSAAPMAPTSPCSGRRPRRGRRRASPAPPSLLPLHDLALGPREPDLRTGLPASVTIGPATRGDRLDLRLQPRA